MIGLDRRSPCRSLPTSWVPSLTGSRDRRIANGPDACIGGENYTLDAGRTLRLNGLRPRRKHSAVERLADANSAKRYTGKWPRFALYG